MQQTHFRLWHFLCEDEACLVERFIVFETDTELKVIFLACMPGEMA